MSIRILLADDHRIMREGLYSLLEKESDMEVVASAADGVATIEMVRELMPDVVVMDIVMPGLNGVEATRQIVTEIPATKVIILSMHSDKAFVLGALQAGASGYILKDCASEELARAIHTVLANETYLSPSIASIVVQTSVCQPLHRSKKSSPSLTARQLEVLQLLCEGKTVKEIAARLYISLKTVETHRRQIMINLDLYSIAELTKYAIRQGITSLQI